MCAAPGGKTIAIAILMKDKGEVIAADQSHNKDAQQQGGVNGSIQNPEPLKSGIQKISDTVYFSQDHDIVESLRCHAMCQKRMFDQAVQRDRPGGVIVYSTCIINPGENEGLVRYALDTYKFL
ncbi:hypothetical protein OROGR_031693 [Orobanche gracilis]